MKQYCQTEDGDPGLHMSPKFKISIFIHFNWSNQGAQQLKEVLIVVICNDRPFFIIGTRRSVRHNQEKKLTISVAEC